MMSICAKISVVLHMIMVRQKPLYAIEFLLCHFSHCFLSNMFVLILFRFGWIYVRSITTERYIEIVFLMCVPIVFRYSFNNKDLRAFKSTISLLAISKVGFTLRLPLNLMEINLLLVCDLKYHQHIFDNVGSSKAWSDKNYPIQLNSTRRIFLKFSEPCDWT